MLSSHCFFSSYLPNSWGRNPPIFPPLSSNFPSNSQALRTEKSSQLAGMQWQSSHLQQQLSSLPLVSKWTSSSSVLQRFQSAPLQYWPLSLSVLILKSLRSWSLPSNPSSSSYVEEGVEEDRGRQKGCSQVIQCSPKCARFNGGNRVIINQLVRSRQ